MLNTEIKIAEKRCRVKPVKMSVEFDVHLMDVNMLDRITVEGLNNVKECARLGAKEAGVDVIPLYVTYIKTEYDVSLFKVVAESPIDQNEFDSKMEAYY